MKRDLHFRKDVLFEALKNTLANVSILLEKGCTNPERLGNYTAYYSSICLKAFYNFYTIDKEYTRKEMALKKYNLLYGEAFTDAIESSEDLQKYLDTKTYNIDISEDEKFIIIAILNLPKFFTSNNPNKIRHIINTYIPKAKKCLKINDYYLSFFDNKMTIMEIKTLLFKFLVENG